MKIVSVRPGRSKRQGGYLDEDTFWYRYGGAGWRPRKIHRFLVGDDDENAFRQRVPASCHTVEEALEYLHPTIAQRPGTIRQGDLYFVPIALSEARRLAINLEHGSILGSRHSAWHCGEIVCGMVTAPDHLPVHLPQHQFNHSYYRVVGNRAYKRWGRD